MVTGSAPISPEVLTFWRVAVGATVSLTRTGSGDFSVVESWGGTHMSEVYGYVPLWWLPFSGYSAAPETHLFTPSVNFYALCFPFSKILAILGPFFSDFGKISAPTHLIHSQDPSFLRKKICSVDPTFENPCGTYPQKIWVPQGSNVLQFESVTVWFSSPN